MYLFDSGVFKEPKQKKEAIEKANQLVEDNKQLNSANEILIKENQELTEELENVNQGEFQNNIIFSMLDNS